MERLNAKQKRTYHMPNGRRHWANKAYLRQHQACVKCGAPSECVDHIQPWYLAEYDAKLDRYVTEDGLDMDDPANLQALCSACHDRKSRVENKNASIDDGRLLAHSLRLALRKDMLAARLQGMRGGGARQRDIMRILAIKSEANASHMNKRLLDANGRSEVTNRLIARWRNEFPNKDVPTLINH